MLSKKMRSYLKEYVAMLKAKTNKLYLLDKPTMEEIYTRERLSKTRQEVEEILAKDFDKKKFS